MNMSERNIGSDKRIPGLGHTRPRVPLLPLLGAVVVTVIHLASYTHDTVSLLGVLGMKPESAEIRMLEVTLTAIVWIGHGFEVLERARHGNRTEREG